MDSMSVSPPPHVVILGCGRSGTSIFGELFEHLAPYSYFSEPPFGDYLALDFERPVAVKVPAVDPQFEPTKGLSFPLETLYERVPENKRFYWIVRHPLDAICSLRPGIANNWGHHPRPPDWRNWLDRPLLEQCAHHWTYLNTVGFQAVEHLAVVQCFEEMIEAPRGFADRICVDLGLSVDDHADELASWARRVQNTNNAQFIEAKTSRNYSRRDHSKRVERWKENLTPEQVETLVPMVTEAAERFGYELT